ncbi:MAG: glutamate dehydrogenase [Flavobacteriaceae bacterium]|nr:glutamate dehydrogenase [Flavobacteriaceae bacterium]
MKNYIKYLIFLLFFINLNSSAQTGYSHEVGVYIGAPSFQTDYGQRNHFMSNVGGNIGNSFGIIHYLQFSDYKYEWYGRGTFFSEHFKIRTEVSFAKSDLKHYGKWVEDDPKRDLDDYLRAMHGTTSMINVGSQLEFYYRDLVDYGLRYYNWNYSPYVGLGVQANFYKPTIISDLGDWKQDPKLIRKWGEPGAANDEAGITASITLNSGTRISLGRNTDLFLETRWHYYLTNWVDGLNAKDDPANKYNDWMFLVQVGFIYSIESR